MWYWISEFYGTDKSNDRAIFFPNGHWRPLVILSLPAGFEWGVHCIPVGSSREMEETKVHIHFDQGTGLENPASIKKKLAIALLSCFWDTLRRGMRRDAELIGIFQDLTEWWWQYWTTLGVPWPWSRFWLPILNWTSPRYHCAMNSLPSLDQGD